MKTYKSYRADRTRWLRASHTCIAQSSNFWHCGRNAAICRKSVGLLTIGLLPIALTLRLLRLNDWLWADDPANTAVAHVTFNRDECEEIKSPAVDTTVHEQRNERRNFTVPSVFFASFFHLQYKFQDIAIIAIHISLLFFFYINNICILRLWKRNYVVSRVNVLITFKHPVFCFFFNASSFFPLTVWCIPLRRIVQGYHLCAKPRNESRNRLIDTGSGRGGKKAWTFSVDKCSIRSIVIPILCCVCFCYAKQFELARSNLSSNAERAICKIQ